MHEWMAPSLTDSTTGTTASGVAVVDDTGAVANFGSGELLSQV